MPDATPPPAAGPRGPVVAVVGPTATGKSDLAVRLAQRIGGEIVNADSMQLYRGMDVGTAKLPAAERGGVPHHLLDVWPLTRSAAVADYQAMARATIAEIHARGNLPVVVGGSGLYLRGALDDLDFPGESPELRAKYEGLLDRHGPQHLHDLLAERDPEAAEAILASNGRRLVRALEVGELTGQPFLARMPGFDAVYDVVSIGLDRDDLDDRVETRVARMWELGFVEEVRALLADGLRGSPTAGKALGYAQILARLDADGHATADLGPGGEAAAETVRATRRFVRRQRSWFRRDPRIHWLDGADARLDARALELIMPTLSR